MEQISMVFQRVYLFQDTIYNNISMGKPDATEEEVYEAAKKARCYDFIMALPDGFQTVIGEGGATLSGGEKQRISIARCINEQQWIRYLFSDYDRLSVGDRGSRDYWYCEICI